MEPLDDPARVAPELAAVLRALEGGSPLGKTLGTHARRDLAAGLLLGLQTSSRRGYLARGAGRRAPGPVQPVEVTSGAVCQSVYLRNDPRDERDVLGFVVTQDGFRGGPVVLAHELTHFRARHVVWSLARGPLPAPFPWLLAGRDRARAGWVRAQLLNEIAARHAAFLVAEVVSPAARLPELGALFACGVKISSYPAVYLDDGTMAALVAEGDDDALHDQVGAWMQGLERFPFFDPGSPDEAAHRPWLERELALARLGRHAPRVAAEGTV